MKNKAYKFRFYPNVKQEKFLSQCFGTKRFIYNTVLGTTFDTYSWFGRSVSEVDISRALTELKNSDDPNWNWLKKIPSTVANQALMDSGKALKSWWKKKSKRPKFKKKNDFKQSARWQLDTRCNNFVEGEILKVTGLGNIASKVKWSRRLQRGVRPKMITISKDASNRYWVSFQVEEDIKLKSKTKKSVGIDLGLNDVFTLSTGEKSSNPRFYKKYQEKLKKEQRKLSRMKKGSNRYQAQKIVVAKVHAKISDSRNHFLHTWTSKIVDQFDSIALETLNVKGMMKNKRLSKSIADASFYKISSMLEYKSDWYGRKLVKADRFYPSSQLCFNCNSKQKISLSQRTYTCYCGYEEDRDVNAAKNLEKLLTG